MNVYNVTLETVVVVVAANEDEACKLASRLSVDLEASAEQVTDAKFLPCACDEEPDDLSPDAGPRGDPVRGWTIKQWLDDTPEAAHNRAFARKQLHLGVGT